tara:strand:+ start:115 stop:312 length:198 start_codon:yes stop_codon:yes gene_type:complete
MTGRVLGNRFQKIRVLSPELNNMHMCSNHKEQVVRDLDSTQKTLIINDIDLILNQIDLQIRDIEL